MTERAIFHDVHCHAPTPSHPNFLSFEEPVQERRAATENAARFRLGGPE